MKRRRSHGCSGSGHVVYHGSTRSKELTDHSTARCGGSDAHDGHSACGALGSQRGFDAGNETRTEFWRVCDGTSECLCGREDGGGGGSNGRTRLAISYHVATEKWDAVQLRLSERAAGRSGGIGGEHHWIALGCRTSSVGVTLHTERHHAIGGTRNFEGITP